MDIDTFKELLKESIYRNYAIIQKTLPYKTGMLSLESFKVKQIDDSHFDISIDLNKTPYAEYINRPGYRTAGYWERAVKQYIDLIAKDLGGYLQ